MNNLTNWLASIVRDKVSQSTLGSTGTIESRFIFHGPPLELLELVYNELADEHGGIPAEAATGETITIPVLLQVPTGQLGFSNPGIRSSGKCDDTHLLDLRNSPSGPRFVALVPPGQHSNQSVTSTTDEFGVGASNNASHVTFDEWWGDGFIQHLINEGLSKAGFESNQKEEARELIKCSAKAMDEVDHENEIRKAAWRLLSRVFSIQEGFAGLTKHQALSLACGVPPRRDEPVSAKIQLDVLQQIAEEFGDGFKSGVECAKKNTQDDNVCLLLDEFLVHIQGNCKIPTAFERATPAFYLPASTLEVEIIPEWWKALTVELWSELFAEEPDETSDLLSIECTNAVFPQLRGTPALVRDEVKILISIGVEHSGGPIDVLLERSAGGRNGKFNTGILVDNSAPFVENLPEHKSPAAYKASAPKFKKTTIKVVSLSSWAPGIFVVCRMAKNLKPLKKPARRTTRENFDWETSLSVPGAGRYELAVFLSPNIIIGNEATGVQDDATEVDTDSKVHQIKMVQSDEYQVEFEADGKYQLDIPFKRVKQDGSTINEICRVYVACDEVNEEGCRSEFERLIKLNRRHLEKFDSKTVVQLDRYARCSSMQSWILDEKHVTNSFRPIVLAEDYADYWIPPNWNGQTGPIFSKGRFLHDPRPAPADFQPPQDFVNARQKIAKIIRGTDEQSGLLESASLGLWLSRDHEFKEIVEQYLDSYLAWFKSDPDVACWVDIILVTSLEQDGRTLIRVPDAILLSPIHPLRLAWHCVAQRVLHETLDGNNPHPCPASSILDPGCVPDLLTLSLQAPGGVEMVDFIAVECNSDYWSVLWNGSRLRHLSERSCHAPFDEAFGITVGGLSSGFSAAQVSRALDDVSDLLAAKPIISLVVSGTGGTTDACNEGLVNWCTDRFGNGDKTTSLQSVGPRMVQIFDTRPPRLQPDDATIANLSEDTENHVRWFNRQPLQATPDLGIIAQLESSEPETTENAMRSPLGIGGLIRHRVRRQLSGASRAFLSESRQGLRMPPSGDILADKVTSCMLSLENRRDSKIGLRFAPNINTVHHMIAEQKAGFVAVSSSSIDPACFLGGWLQGAYLWDYDLPSYSHRAGDTDGYYLLAQIKEADRDGLRRVLSSLPGCKDLLDDEIEQILHEVARRGIPTVRGLSGDDTGATGDLGLFLAARLLQDQFRIAGNVDSLLPVLGCNADGAWIAIVIPVDPFRGYLADLARSLGKDRKDISLSRPDLLVVGMHLGDGPVQIHLTPIEVKCRQSCTLGPSEVSDALGQAKSLSTLLSSIEGLSKKYIAWKLAYQHLLLSMIGFGLRVYSQNEAISGQASRWAEYHERIAATILDASSVITIDPTGRLVVVDESAQSDSHDRDRDGMEETIVISSIDAGRIVAGDAQGFYNAVRSKVGNWDLFPRLAECKSTSSEESIDGTSEVDVVGHKDDDLTITGPNVVIESETEISQLIPSLNLIETDTDLQDSQENPGIIISVGQTVDGFEPRPLSLNISDTRLNQLNIGVVGDLGTGKTQLLKSLILQITKDSEVNRGITPRFLIFDYKRDYSTPDFVQATGAKVVKPTRLPLNLFDTSSMGESSAPWLGRFLFFADVLDKIYSGIGPVQRDKLKGAVRSAYELCEAAESRQPTIYDVHAAYRELLGGKSDSPMAIIDDLVDMEVFSRNPQEILPFDKFLDGVVVISLDAMGQDDRSKNMLVAIMLNMFYENMLRTTKHPYVGINPQLRVIDSYLLVDEADNIMRYEFDVLRKLLLQGREFGAGIILASQYLRHFKVSSTDYRDPLLTWFIHKVPNVTPSELGALGFTSDLAELSERVKTLPNHQCLYKSFDIAGEVIKTLPFYELIKP